MAAAFCSLGVKVRAAGTAPSPPVPVASAYLHLAAPAGVLLHLGVGRTEHVLPLSPAQPGSGSSNSRAGAEATTDTMRAAWPGWGQGTQSMYWSPAGAGAAKGKVNSSRGQGQGCVEKGTGTQRFRQCKE